MMPWEETPPGSKQVRIKTPAMNNMIPDHFFLSGGEVMLALDDVLSEPWLVCSWCRMDV